MRRKYKNRRRKRVHTVTGMKRENREQGKPHSLPLLQIKEIPSHIHFKTKRSEHAITKTIKALGDLCRRRNNLMQALACRIKEETNPPCTHFFSLQFQCQQFTYNVYSPPHSHAFPLPLTFLFFILCIFLVFFCLVLFCFVQLTCDSEMAKWGEKKSSQFRAVITVQKYLCLREKENSKTRTHKIIHYEKYTHTHTLATKSC